MIVCAHGNVEKFCKEHDMVIIEQYDGDLEQYTGLCRVIVTDADMEQADYYLLKGKMLAMGIELVSTQHRALEDVSYEIAKLIKRKKTGGRTMFGFQKVDGELKLTEMGRAVVARIFELRDLGYPYRMIREDEGVYHPSGRKLSVSTIAVIVSNREKYEKEGL